jgi:hypothetical protein
MLASSLFNQLLDHFPVPAFALLVKKHQAERNAKGSCNGLACCQGKLAPPSERSLLPVID